MFSDKKEEGMLPDLPPVKTPFGFSYGIDHDPEEASEIHSLPSFPDSSTHNDFSQAAIKDAVGTEEAGEMPAIPGEEGKDIKLVEMKEWDPVELPESAKEEEHMVPPPMPVPPVAKIAPPPEMGLGERKILPPLKMATSPVNAGNLDVFVKLDKFHSAKKTLGEVKSKLEEVDGLIRKIREVKMREEQEIASWEKDLTFARSRIQEITENIFEKVG